MLKYADTLVTFREIPNEITLCINITNCPNNCPGCHSPWLAKDIGIELTKDELKELINSNKGISCICLMGGDINPKEVNELALFLKQTTNLKVGWYSGKQVLPKEIDLNNFDYVKLGPYQEQDGPLTERTTNQVLFKIDHIRGDYFVTDITAKFWK